MDLVKIRDEAFIEFVKTGSFEKVNAYCKKYGVQMTENPTIKAAGIYKAVQLCSNIPQDIKDKAKLKCKELGFNPFSNCAFIKGDRK